MQKPLQLSGTSLSELDIICILIQTYLPTKRVSIGYPLAVKRPNNLAVRRKNWQILTVSRKKYVWWKQ